MVFQKLSVLLLFISLNIYAQDSCSELSQDECVLSSECEINYDASGQFEGCVDIEDDGGVPDCILDCPGVFDINSDNSDELCDWVISINGTECMQDCDEETMFGFEYLSDACFMCLSNENIDCADVLDDDSSDWNGDDGGDNMDFCREFDEAMCEDMPFCEWTDEGCVMSSFGDDGGWDDFNCEEIASIEECYQAGCEWGTVSTPNGFFEMCLNPEDDGGDEDDGPPECLLDCAGIETVNPDQDPYGACDWIVSNFGPNNFFNECANDCDDETMMIISELSEMCFICLSDENIDCGDIWLDGDDSLCVDLSEDECFATDGCEWIPSNSPVESGSCVDSDLGDDGGSEDGCFENGEWYCYGCELFVNECEYYECTENGWTGPFDTGDCWNNCSDIETQASCLANTDCMWVFDNPLTDSGFCTDNNTDSGDEAVLRLEHVAGMPGTVVAVPLLLSNFESVSGLQFSFSYDSPYNNEPALTIEEFEILDDCFSGSYNQINNQMIGIIFSLEGCVYEPSEFNHIGNILVYINEEVPAGSELPLEFIYTLVSNPSGNEIPSYGENSSIAVGVQGDVNLDGEINVLDIVMVVNFAIYLEEPSDSQFWASDINYDGQINVLDIVQLINLILGR